MYDLATLWLVAAVQKGVWMMCFYAPSPPTVMRPEPPVRVVKLYDADTMPGDGCPVRILESTTILPEDAA